MFSVRAPRSWLVLVALCSVRVAELRAQSVRLTVVDQNAQPAAGAVAQLLDTVGTIVARGLADARGVIILRARSEGTHRARVLRIGSSPRLSDTLLLRTGDVRDVRMSLEPLPTSLQAVTIGATSACQPLAQRAEAFAWWQDARVALSSTGSSAPDRTTSTAVVLTERVLDRSLRRVLSEATSSATVQSGQPWRAPTIVELLTDGYVVRTRDTTEYRAPSLDVLASDEFVSSHCFRIQADAVPDRIGVAFEPLRAARGYVDVSGTLWLDRATRALSQVEFAYTNLPRQIARLAGGRIDLQRLRDSSWVVTRWELRMPVYTMRRGGFAGAEPEAIVSAVRVRSGALRLAVSHSDSSSTRDTLWIAPTVTTRGVVVDSLTGERQANALLRVVGTSSAVRTDSSGLFVLTDLHPGEYDVEVTTGGRAGAVSLAKLLASEVALPVTVRISPPMALLQRICPSMRSTDGAALTGTILTDLDSVELRGIRVSATWYTLGVRRTGSGGQIERTRTVREAAVGSDGSFVLCNVPADESLDIRASGRALESELAQISVPSSQRVARLDLVAGRAVGTRVALRGRVTAGATNRPIANAEIQLPEADRLVRTDSSGAFALSGLMEGTYRVLVRAVGYLAREELVTVSLSDQASLDLPLSAVATLDSVVTTATRRLSQFEANRRVGLGRFLASAELEKMRGVALPNVLAQLGGVSIIRGKGSAAWAASSRGVKSLGRTSGTNPSEFDASRGATKACYAHVWLDGVQVYFARDREPLFDLGSLQIADLAGIEYYAGAAELPERYTGNKSACGVVSIWTK